MKLDSHHSIVAKPIIEMNCDAPAAEGIQIVLRRRLEEMCALRDRALDWGDPEGVHDMRVASRRLRSAVSDFKPHLRRGALPRGRLKMIAGALGAVRDEDVSLLALEDLKARAEGRVAEGIEAIAEERRRRRLQERAALEQSISKTAIDEFQQQFLMRLESAVQVSGQSRAAKRARKLVFRQVGVEVITNRLRGLTTGSECIYDPTRNKELHRLRILAKRSRYAVELFASCWPEEFAASAKEIARLQTSLGGLHDCDMWIDDLGARLKKNSRAQDPHYNDAAVWLLGYFARQRTRHYRDALARCHEWQTRGFLTNLRTLLRPGKS